MSDIVYFKQDGTDVDVTISEVGLNSATLTALETISLSSATLTALETTELGSTTLAALETTELGSTTLAALENITVDIGTPTVSLSTATLAALETTTVGLSSASLTALEETSLKVGSTAVSHSAPLPVSVGPIGSGGGAVTHTNVGDTHVPLVATSSGQPLSGTGVVEHLGVLVKNASGSSTVISLYWTSGTASSAVLARSKVTLANSDAAHINFPPGTYSTNNIYLAITTTASSGVTAYSHYHQLRAIA
jgi:hypothetical protein